MDEKILEGNIPETRKVKNTNFNSDNSNRGGGNRVKRRRNERI